MSNQIVVIHNYPDPNYVLVVKILYSLFYIIIVMLFRDILFVLQKLSHGIFTAPSILPFDAS